MSGYSGQNFLSLAKKVQNRSLGGTNDGENFDDNNSEDDFMVWMDLEKLGNLFSHDGSSYFLRIGAVSKYCLHTSGVESL